MRSAGNFFAIIRVYPLISAFGYVLYVGRPSLRFQVVILVVIQNNLDISSSLSIGRFSTLINSCLRFSPLKYWRRKIKEQ
jgi:hypothetical protein